MDKENNLSFAFNTDGVPLFKSSKVSMWPVYILVNELPPHAERKLRENVLFYGVWISILKKPIMWSFLKSLYDDISKLEDGVILLIIQASPSFVRLLCLHARVTFHRVALSQTVSSPMDIMVAGFVCKQEKGVVGVTSFPTKKETPKDLTHT